MAVLSFQIHITFLQAFVFFQALLAKDCWQVFADKTVFFHADYRNLCYYVSFFASDFSK